MKDKKNGRIRIETAFLVILLAISSINHFAARAVTITYNGNADSYPLESFENDLILDREQGRVVVRVAEQITSRSTTTPPVIDGVLDDLWGVPQLDVVFTLNNQAHPLKAYFLCDNRYLYVAIEVKKKELNDYHYWGISPLDVMEIYFDNNNNEVTEIGETVLNFWGLQFGDWIYKGDSVWGAVPDHTSGASGVASHNNPDGRGDYVYEFQIPRNLFTSDIVGIKLNYRVMEYNSEREWYYSWREQFIWPAGYRFDATTYAKLRLAPGESFTAEKAYLPLVFSDK